MNQKLSPNSIHFYKGMHHIQIMKITQLKKSLLLGIVLLYNLTSTQANIKNPSFEKDKINSERQIVQKLGNWEITSGNVELITSKVFPSADGGQVLDLNGDQPGSIIQTIKGLDKSANYTLKFAYADQKSRKSKAEIMASADIFINGEKVTTLRNLSPSPDYIDGIGFAFQATAKGTATIEFVSTTPGESGLVIDNLRIEEGLPLAPPVNDRLVNGSFEMKVDSESGNPHIYGDQLPGWTIMRENIDLIAIDAFGTLHKKWVIDLGGHGAGGIAQTVQNLQPGAPYRLSMLYSRHKYWDQEDPLTGEVFLNDELVLSLSRDKSNKAPRLEKVTDDFVAPSNGKVTLSMYSTAYKVGGGVLYDDVRIEKVSDIAAPKKIHVMIIDGFSNHAWENNTAYLKKILETSGKFEVSVSTCPNRETNEDEWNNWKPNFEAFPVVIQTCNNVFKEDKLNWPDRVKKSFEKYISEGGGLYVYHGGNNAFKNWPAYNQMIGLGWRSKDFGKAITVDKDEKINIVPKGEGENTGHGKRRDVLITRIGKHPIHIGMPKTWRAADLEVYRYARGPAENLQVLSFGSDEKTGLNFPLEWVVQFGKGKVYSSTYGHVWKDSIWPESIRCAAFQQTLFRVLQWLSGNEVANYVEADFPKSESPVLRSSIGD
jgi:type 1 glutamine amidotransferase